MFFVFDIFIVIRQVRFFLFFLKRTLKVNELDDLIKIIFNKIKNYENELNNNNNKNKDKIE